MPTRLSKVREQLAADGLLMQADPALPSVTTLVAGKPVQGSWWGHPSGKAIFAVCEALDDDPDVLATKLINGKITFVHRRLWSSLLSVATSGEPWQLEGLSREARRLLEKVSSEGRIEAAGKPGAELERRLLVLAHSIHSPQGKHVQVVESWEHWLSSVRFKPRAMTPSSARAKLERITATWHERAGVRVRLPWITLSRERSRQS